MTVTLIIIAVLIVLLVIQQYRYQSLIRLTKQSFYKRKIETLSHVIKQLRDNQKRTEKSLLTLAEANQKIASEKIQVLHQLQYLERQVLIRDIVLEENNISLIEIKS